MSKVIVFLANGHEECEALIPADLLRRAGVEVVLASITGKKEVTGSHGIHVTADALAERSIMIRRIFFSFPADFPERPIWARVHWFAKS